MPKEKEKPKNEFKHESVEDKETLIKYLEAIQEGFHKGVLILGTENHEIDLIPQNLIKLTIYAKNGKEGSEISIKMSWKENEPTESTDVENKTSLQEKLEFCKK
jgi:amphi-Trp domain-containing protein